MQKKSFILSGNALKMIAAVSMTIDHIGLIFYPRLLLLRTLGRFAFPIFAFFIAEGCKYTRNKARYLGTMAGAALIFQVVYYFAMQTLYMSIFVTFSLSIVLIYLLDFSKQAFCEGKKGIAAGVLFALLFLLAIQAAWQLNQIQIPQKRFSIDYGFWGIMTPVFASLFHPPKNAPELWKKLDKPFIGALLITIPLFAMTYPLRLIFPYKLHALLAVPLLLFYSGKRGKYKMKYFFYLFYPLHLVLLYGIYYFL